MYLTEEHHETGCRPVWKGPITREIANFARLSPAGVGCEGGKYASSVFTGPAVGRPRFPRGSVGSPVFAGP